MLATACATGTANLGLVDDAGAASGSGGAGASGGAGGEVTIGLGGNISTGAGTDVCPPEAKLIYLADYTGDFFSFNPSTLTVTEIGYFHCPGAGVVIPFSMAIDRTAKAWISTKSGEIFTLDTTTLDCQATAFVPNQVDNFAEFGMAFVSDAPGSAAETLYLSSFSAHHGSTDHGLGSGVGIAKLDTTTFQITPLGKYAMPGAASITGTGDARLFGFFKWEPLVTAPPMLAEIDKSNSNVSNQQTVLTADASDWPFGALAFWGGDFYLFNDVTAYKHTTATNTTTVAVPVLGSSPIIGAAVSTCAPVEPPK